MERLLMDTARSKRLRLESVAANATSASSTPLVPGKGVVLFHRTMLHHEYVYRKYVGKVGMAEVTADYFCMNIEWAQGRAHHNQVHCPYSWLRDVWLDERGQLCIQLQAIVVVSGHGSAPELMPAD